MYICYSILECYNLFSGVRLSIRSFCFIWYIESKIGCILRKILLSEVQICEKVKNRRIPFLENNLISQIHKKKIVSLIGLSLSFSDWGCLIIEFVILKSTVGCKLIGLPSLNTWE